MLPRVWGLKAFAANSPLRMEDAEHRLWDAQASARGDIVDSRSFLQRLRVGELVAGPARHTCSGKTAVDQ